MKIMGNKRGEILIENVLFILLTTIFIFLLILFLIKQGNGTIVLEQIYAKEIALSIDYAKPIMLIKIDMEKGLNIAKKNGIDFNNVVQITDNVVKVKLSQNSGYTYSFFNDVEVGAYPDRDKFTGKYTGSYVFVVGEKNG
jgi:lipoprotein signal peptidase